MYLVLFASGILVYIYVVTLCSTISGHVNHALLCDSDGVPVALFPSSSSYPSMSISEWRYAHLPIQVGSSRSSLFRPRYARTTNPNTLLDVKY